ncbi:MAG: hypothetical protein IJA05_05965 [Oscillospiraceae bacterium]|nr:hypothetical protein [Oscillospiraceae bacterium]
MFDALNLMWIVPFCLGTGFFFAQILKKDFEIGQDKKDIKENISAEENCVLKEENLDPMTLRNGMNVTKLDKPTFAEQWVNVMKYIGENQMEVDYEEDYRSEENLE